jgi:hypothetical protein
LDWREICDGKSDCLDSSDENNCWQLEVNDCDDNEFRCHNGLCIPIEFFRDVMLHSDCLDRTDELLFKFDTRYCYRQLAFSCDEHTCEPGTQEFSCGDGQCTTGIELCYNGRYHLLPNNLCARAMDCFYGQNEEIGLDWCDNFCTQISCLNDNCAKLYESLYMPVIFGHVRFIYLDKELKFSESILPNYVCYDEKLCSDFLPAKEHFNNLTCRHINDLGLKDINSYDPLKMLITNIKKRFRSCLVVTNEIFYCNYSTMYQCLNSSKCISKQRLLDGFQDCPNNDDETLNQSCSLSDSRQCFKCFVDGMEKCLASLINERNETDETDCAYWPCNNTYSRCDTFWLCKDGADEVNCPPSTCPKHHHDCVFPNDTSKVSCLPIEQADNNIDDCLGATDEQRKYPITLKSSSYYVRYKFQCWNDMGSIFVDKLCNKEQDCQFNDDEIFCTTFGPESRYICASTEKSLTKVEQFFCDVHRGFTRPGQIYFRLTNIATYPMTLVISDASSVPSTRMKSTSIDENWPVKMVSDDTWLCNKGVPIHLRMDDDNTSELYCLCPANYYGKRCQYQNQRVSLTIQIQVSSDWYKVFIFIITLIDNERNIESYDYIEYLPIRHCNTKYNIYLLYSSRPKNTSKIYSVKIDLFNQLTLSYRASWIFPLQFSFLPVHRLPVLLKVPFSNMVPIDKCLPSCVHGHYVNDQNSMFCHCATGSA